MFKTVLNSCFKEVQALGGLEVSVSEFSLEERLVCVLEEETAIYEEFAANSRDKTKIIIGGNIGELENLNRQEEFLIARVRKAEETRERIVSELARRFGVKERELTVAGLLKSGRCSQPEKLKVCQDKMTRVLNELKSLNELNARLIENSLEYIAFSLNLLAAAEAGTGNYGSSGRVESGGRNRSFVDVKL